VGEEVLQFHRGHRASTVAVTEPSMSAIRLASSPLLSAEDRDAGEVGLVPVVEDEIVAGGVVAHVPHVGVCALGLAFQRQRTGQRAGLLDAAVVGHLHRDRQLRNEVARPGLSCRVAAKVWSPIVIWMFMRFSWFSTGSSSPSLAALREGGGVGADWAVESGLPALWSSLVVRLATHPAPSSAARTIMGSEVNIALVRDIALRP
jgi:hypothetical protein